MKLVQLIGLALFASAGVAMANEGHDASTSTSTSTTKSETWQAAGSDFDKLDKNGDGYLSKTEAQDDVSDYTMADRNSDGRLDRSEFSAMELKSSEHSTTSDTKHESSSSTMHTPSDTTSSPTDTMEPKP